MRLLVALGDRVGGEYLIAYAKLLAQRADVTVRVVHVVAPIAGSGPVAAQIRADAATLVDDGVDMLALEGIDAHGAVIFASENAVAVMLVDEAERWQADLIVLNARRRSKWRSFVGRGIREQVVRRSEIPTALVATPPCVTVRTRERGPMGSGASRES